MKRENRVLIVGLGSLSCGSFMLDLIKALSINSPPIVVITAEEVQQIPLKIRQLEVSEIRAALEPREFCLFIPKAPGKAFPEIKSGKRDIFRMPLGTKRFVSPKSRFVGCG